MKKMFALIMAIALCVSMAACGGKKPVQSEIDLSDKTNVELAIESVNTLLASDEYTKMNSEFENTFGQESCTPKVNYVMEYQLDGFDGFNLHFLLIDLEVNFFRDDCGYDRTTLLVDLDNGKWCDEVRSDFGKWQKSFGGVCESIEDCYFIFLQNTFVDAGKSGSVFWSENENYTVLIEEELAQINAGLNIG